MLNKIKLPKKMSANLAEICGIHAGDGYLRDDGKRRELEISGNIQEKEFYTKNVAPLFKKVFNIDVKLRPFLSKKTFGFVIRNKEVIGYFNKFLRFPLGRKTTIVKVPNKVLITKSKKIYAAFLKGLFDTDGCLSFSRRGKTYSVFKRRYHVDPRIIFSTVSRNLSKDIQYMLRFLEIPFCKYVVLPKNRNELKKYVFRIVGKRRLLLWLKVVGFKNPIQLTRYKVWRKYGFSPPYTTVLERQDILNNKTDIYSYYKAP